MSNEILYRFNMCRELQDLDANCNNCKHMVRDADKFKVSLEKHHKWQFDYFNTMKRKMVEKAKWWKDKENDLEKYNDLLMEADRMKFQFDKSTCAINYGHCSKFDKPVSFIPNTCQLDTQECFENRKQI